MESKWMHEACDESGLPVASVPPKDPAEAYVNGVINNIDRISREIAAERRNSKPAVVTLKTVVKGVGPDAETVVNPSGGKQSKSTHRCDLLPAKATLHIAEILEQGARKYGANNWRNICCQDHLNHALVHAFAYLAGDGSDDHLGHFACRALMALEKGWDEPIS